MSQNTTANVRMFGPAADVAGADEITVELPAGSTLNSLIVALAKEHPGLAPIMEDATILMMSQAVTRDQLLPVGEVTVEVMSDEFDG